MNDQSWYVYIIEASDGSLYTGITTNVQRRFNEHLNGKQAGSKGAKYFHGRKPEKIVYVEEDHNRSSASKREAEIKKLRREQKLFLIKSVCSDGN